MENFQMRCEYEGCFKTYNSLPNLKRHVESFHKGINRYQCPTCGKGLSSKQNLKDHQNIHTGAKPYVCEVEGCGATLRQLSQYYVHKQIHKEEEKKDYSNFSYLHIIKYLTARLESAVCKKSCEPKALPEDGGIVLPRIQESQVDVRLPQI